MFKHFRERLAFAIAPWTRPSTVVERVTPYLYTTTTTGTSEGGRSFVWIPGDIKETA